MRSLLISMLDLLIFLYLLFCLILGISSSVRAQEFYSDFQVDYYPSIEQKNLTTKVNFKIKITNLKSDVYVKSFIISFPKSFLIKNIKAADDQGPITPEITTSDNLTKISLTFINPKVGRNSVNSFLLEFYQDNLFQANGNIWEVIIPTIENKNEGNYKIIVHLPQDTNKKISISKPVPNTISADQIIWENPKVRTIYAVFGQMQYYRTTLIYHLKNSQLTPGYLDIAFPPDTLYQKVYVEKISPLPAQISIDSDGNYLGRYYLKPKEEKNVTFKGSLVEFFKPRDEIVSSTKAKIKSQEKYLLSQARYWTIKNIEKIAGIPADPKSIYDFVTQTLAYNYQKTKQEDNQRLGADQVLLKPDQAVCMEFTDLFIAIAREKGIFTREVEGYGFTKDDRIRPLLYRSDILHSWPEYYNQKTGIWIPVDPTWGNTSGIDYFSSFDLNHLTFAIHGKNSQYPLPAGAYKIRQSKDIIIEPAAAIPQDKIRLLINPVNFPKKINDQKEYQVLLNIKNASNVFLWKTKIPIFTKNLQVSPSSFELDSFAPLQTQKIILSIKSSLKTQVSKGEILIRFPDNQKIASSIEIVPFYYQLAIATSVLLLSVFWFIFSIILFKKIWQRLFFPK